MIPARFECYRPASLDEAIQLLRQHGEEAKLLAGGHSLIPMMKLRLAEPGVLVDVGRLPGLAGVRERDGRIAIGALSTHHSLESSELLRRRAQLVAEAAGQIGDVQVRNRGTIGGSLVHADPGADLPSVMLALDAELVLRGPNGERVLPARDFFVDMLTTATRPDEILTEVRIPALPQGSGSAYLKYPNPASGYSIVGVAAVVSLGQDGACQDVRVGIGGAGPLPVRASAAEAALRGQRPSPEAIEAAAARAADAVDALDDIHASATYRLHLVRVYTRRALEEAIRRARAS
jgi:aerobic carbon-monoxide dehydrogenase medium subunit